MSAQILVIEDDVDSRRALTDVLTDRGYRVAAVGSVDEAMALLEREPRPALIVLDLYLPDKDGWDFRHAQKRDPRIADIPVIVTSAVGKLVDAEVCLRKPLDYDEFLAAVRRYVDPA